MKSRKDMKENRKNIIYNLLYEKQYSKQELAEYFNVTTKTIENTIKECEDIRYSKKLGSYYFKDLLPRYVSYKNYFNLCSLVVANPEIYEDMMRIQKSLDNTFDQIMIDTSRLSELSKKLLRVSVAINHACILKIEYIGNKKSKETKYIRPHKIFSSESIFYLLATYDKRNKQNIGEERRFAFNGIISLEPVEYVKDANFRSEEEVSLYGSLENAKSIKLILRDAAANFFKREGMFRKPNFEFLSELRENEIEIKMYYNNDIEVIKLVQQWMPQIIIADESDDAKDLVREIQNNFTAFIAART